MNVNENLRKKNQRTLILMVLAFIVPVVAAYLVFINMDGSGKTNNYGDLIVPARPLVSFKLQTIEGKAFGLKQLKGNWHLIYIGNGACEQQCQDSLSKMHQTRMAQGKPMSRVRLLYLALDKKALVGMKELQGRYSHLTVITGKKAAISHAVKPFKTDNKHNIQDGGLIFMTDPLGNLMMRYEMDIRLIGMIKDLEHLLKVSQIG